MLSYAVAALLCRLLPVFMAAAAAVAEVAAAAPEVGRKPESAPLDGCIGGRVQRCVCLCVCVASAGAVCCEIVEAGPGWNTRK